MSDTIFLINMYYITSLNPSEDDTNNNHYAILLYCQSQISDKILSFKQYISTYNG